MDTSEEYIKMCWKAEEIQEIHPKLKRNALNSQQRESLFKSMLMNHLGRGICCDGYSGNWWFIKVNGICVLSVQEDELVWLPRQDQLQDMIGGRFYDLIFSIYTWMQTNRIAGHDETAEVEYYNSMEQLWLAFVMHEKFGKIWRDNKWLIRGI